MSQDPEEINLSIGVAAKPALAFQIFTEDIDLWWRRGPVYRTGKANTLRIEPFVGGRFIDVHPSNGTSRDIGRVLIWEPGRCFRVEWRAVNFTAGEVTLVEVTFEPEGEGSRVAIRHWGWDSLAADHPVRHGQTGAAFVHLQSRWWADLLTAWQRHVAAGNTT